MARVSPPCLISSSTVNGVGVKNLIKPHRAVVRPATIKMKKKTAVRACRSLLLETCPDDGLFEDELSAMLAFVFFDSSVAMGVRFAIPRIVGMSSVVLHFGQVTAIPAWLRAIGMDWPQGHGSR